LILSFGLATSAACATPAASTNPDKVQHGNFANFIISPAHRLNTYQLAITIHHGLFELKIDGTTDRKLANGIKGTTIHPAYQQKTVIQRQVITMPATRKSF
jgi:hypothetical protein